MLLFWIAGVIMVGFEIYWFHEWWGLPGVLGAIVVPPLAALFPFIYLVMEGFSPLYFGIWALGLLGALTSSNTSSR